MILLTFLLTGTVLVMAASWLVRAGDTLAEMTGLGRVWVGAILIAAATSLPELATDVAAVRLGASDLAAGDLFGSSMANMLILAVLDLLPNGRRVLQRAALDNILVATLAIGLNALAAMAIASSSGTAIWGVAPASVLLLVVYVAGSRAIFRQGRKEPETLPSLQRRDHKRWAAVLGEFLLAAGIIVAIAPHFSEAGDALAVASGLGHTVIGTLLLGLTTSLPEVAASLAALRMGAFDLAVGNLFGSNAINMVIFLAMDVADGGAAIFGGLDSGLLTGALIAIILMSMGMAAMVYRVERRFSLLEPSSLLMVVTYLIGAAILLRSGLG